MLGHVEIAPRRPTAVRETPLIGVLRDTLEYAREREYIGWDHGDGMSSRVRRALRFENRWVNLAFQETIRHSPVNLRPLFLVEQRCNYTGAALFAVANLTFNDLVSEIAYAREDRSNGVDYRAEATELVDWLLEHRCEGHSGFCGGHRHPVQHRHRRRDPSDPDVTATAHAVRALLAAEQSGERYARIARTAARFVEEHLGYRDVEGGSKLRTHDGRPETVHEPNADAHGARLLVDLYERFGDPEFRKRARQILDYIAEAQTEEGDWLYDDPQRGATLGMASPQIGAVIASFLRYQEVFGTDRYEDTLADALPFYRETLFEEDGAPNWNRRHSYPRDVHAAAQGVLVFTRAGDLGFANRIIDWTLDNLHAGDGRFYYRKQRFYTRRTTLMRRCQAWMAYALSEYLSAKHDRTDPDVVLT